MTLRARRIAVLVGAGVVCSGALAAWLALGPRRTPEGQTALAAIGPGREGALRNAFNAAVGQTRIVVLLSPT